MSARLMPLRYAGTCSRCEAPVAARDPAWWEAEQRAVTCTVCRPTDHRGPPPSDGRATIQSEPTSLALDQGRVGASAEQEYRRRHQHRAQRIDEQWGRLAGVVKWITDDPQSTRAWGRGSGGGRRLAATLARPGGDRVTLLHDRKVPGTRGNIDHLAIAPSGIWVIDTKHYRGVVEHRQVATFFQTDYRLYVGGQDRCNLTTGLESQVAAVRPVLNGAPVPITPALCFVGAEWRLFAKPFRHAGVWIIWGSKLAELIAAPGPLTSTQVVDIARRLAIALPPAAASA
jgi:hypothetical protein